MSLTCSIPLEMCFDWLFCIDQWDQLYTSTEIEIDPADYPGLVGARFEVVLDATWGEVDQPIRLVDAELNVYAEIIFPWESYRPGTFGDSHLRKSVGFTLAPVKKKYYVQIICADVENWGTLDDFRTARIWLDVVDSERVRIQIPLLDGDQSTGGGLDSPEENDQWSWFNYTADYKYIANYPPPPHLVERLLHDSWGYSDYDGDEPVWWTIFLLEKSKWQTVDHWTFEVTGAQLDTYAIGSYYEGEPMYDPGRLDVAIFNKTKDVMVAGTQLSFTEYMPTRKTVDFSNSAVNWDDGDEFEVRMKCPYTGVEEYYSTFGVLYRCVLYCTLDPATKTQVYLKTGGTWGGTDPTSRLLYQPNLYPVGTKVYFESTLSHVDDAALMDRLRSGEISALLADNHRYIVRSYYEDGIACVALEEGGFYDTGNYAWYKFPGSATIIDNGHLFDPVPGSNIPLGNIGWLDKDGILQDDNVLARIQLNVANDTATLELGDFHFDDIVPLGTNINSVVLTGIFACIGPPQWVDDFVPTMGSGDPQNAAVEAVPYLGGVVQGSWVTKGCNNWFILEPGWPHFDMLYPQNAWAQPAPVFWPLSGGGTFTFYKSPWLLSDLVNANFKIRVRVKIYYVNRLLQFEFCWCRAMVNAQADIVEVCIAGSRSHGDSFLILEFEGNITPEKDCIFSFPDPNSELPR